MDILFHSGHTIIKLVSFEMVFLHFVFLKCNLSYFLLYFSKCLIDLKKSAYNSSNIKTDKQTS